jgi:hypothetical protein
MGPTAQLIGGLLVLFAILAGIGYWMLRWLDRQKEIAFKPPDVKVAQKVNSSISLVGAMFRYAAGLAGIVLVYYFGYLVYWCFLEPTHKPPDVFGGQAACGACLQFVTDSLETPATAVFPSRFGAGTQIKKLSENFSVELRPVYQVVSYVDAQNKFGATIRTRFTCIVSWSAKQQQWGLMNLDTSPWNEPR